MRNLIIDLNLKMLQLATACDGVHTSKMNCSLWKKKIKISLSLSDRQKWKKSSHSSPPSWLDSFFHAASLQWLPQKQLLSTFAGGGGGEVGFSWGDCVPVWCLWLLLASLFSTRRRQNNFSERLHHKQITRLQPAGDGHTAGRASCIIYHPLKCWQH